ncbi:MAG: hypothetical protein HY261_02430, partial [Chloroflexi bacterium]|nr:hypothetical protein [Chloroflexota bacterium]
MPFDTEAKRIIDTVLAASRAEQTEVTVQAVDSSLTRFANNEVHQNVAQRDTSIWVRACVGRRFGVATINDPSGAALAACAEKALEIAQAMPDQGEDYIPLPAPQHIPRIDGYNVATAEFGPMQRAAGARVICARASEAGFNAAGAFRVDVAGL